MSTATRFRWSDGTLTALDDCELVEHNIAAADSLLIAKGRAFGLGLHLDRFLRAVAQAALPNGPSRVDATAMWDAALALIPRTGEWFPRYELRSTPAGSHLAFRLRSAPLHTRAVVLMTHVGPDPRTVPEVKGPDLESLVAARTNAQKFGADDTIFLTQNGHIIDGATNALVWWRGETLCAPPQPQDDPAFARVDSITAKSLLALAAALGYDTRAESAEPMDLDGCEVWALNALHGIRIVTDWHAGPQLAEKPGRIGAWRSRRQALTAPIGDHAQ